MTTPHRCPHGGTAEEMCDLCFPLTGPKSKQPKATTEQAAPDELWLYLANLDSGVALTTAPDWPGCVRYVKAPRAAVGSQEGAAPVLVPLEVPASDVAPSCDRDVADGAALNPLDVRHAEILLGRFSQPFLNDDVSKAIQTVIANADRLRARERELEAELGSTAGELRAFRMKLEEIAIWANVDTKDSAIGDLLGLMLTNWSSDRERAEAAEARVRELEGERDEATARAQLWYDQSVFAADALRKILTCSDDNCAVDVARAALEAK